MSNVLEIVDSLQSKLTRLLSKYELLQIENQQLLEKSEKLVLEVQEKLESISSLENRYESLRIANAIVGSKEDKHTTKLKINTLIREIDKCIAQLDE
jgi:FtsZ-binding cell division protein ZapB